MLSVTLLITLPLGLDSRGVAAAADAGELRGCCPSRGVCRPGWVGAGSCPAWHRARELRSFVAYEICLGILIKVLLGDEDFRRGNLW